MLGEMLGEMLDRLTGALDTVRDVGFDFVLISFLLSCIVGYMYSQNKCQEILDYFFIDKKVLEEVIWFHWFTTWKPFHYF